MHRLLYGRLLYLVGGLLVALLYWNASRVQLPAPEDVASAPAMLEDSAWWPSDVNPAAMRQRVTQSPHLLFTLTVLMLFTFGMLAGGIVLTVWSCWSGRVRSLWRFASHRLPPWSMGDLGRILLLTLIVAGLMPFVHIALVAWHLDWQHDTRFWITTSMLFLDLVVILIVLAFASAKTHSRSAWDLLGVSPRRLGTAIEAGFRGYMAVFPWLFLLLFMMVELARALGIKPPVEPIQTLLFQEQRPLVLAMTLLLACAIGPLAEELLFRGVVYPALRRRISRLGAMAISAAAFALLHTNLIGFVPIMLLGCLLAYLYERTGSLVAPLAVHVLHNTFLIVVALTYRELMAA